jgi:hypothetical protein
MAKLMSEKREMKIEYDDGMFYGSRGVLVRIWQTVVVPDKRVADLAIVQFPSLLAWCEAREDPPAQDGDE